MYKITVAGKTSWATFKFKFVMVAFEVRDFHISMKEFWIVLFSPYELRSDAATDLSEKCEKLTVSAWKLAIKLHFSEPWEHVQLIAY